MTSERCDTMSPLPETTAADVSSHEVSMPRTIIVIRDPVLIAA
jgi:hypothetical protein